MSSLRRLLSLPLAYRRISRAMERQASAQEQTNVLLQRLVEHVAPFAPELPQNGAKTAETDAHRARLSDISHLDVDEMQIAEAFIAKWTELKGQEPGEEEILAEIAAVKTRNLAHLLR